MKYRRCSAGIARLHVERLINEPSVAALAYRNMQGSLNDGGEGNLKKTCIRPQLWEQIVQMLVGVCTWAPEKERFQILWEEQERFCFSMTVREFPVALGESGMYYSYIWRDFHRAKTYLPKKA